MKKRTSTARDCRWFLIGALIGAAGLAACGGSDAAGGDPGRADAADDEAASDAGSDVQQDSPDIEQDTGAEVGPDAQQESGSCVGIGTCVTAGTSCNADTLVACAEDGNGCLVESTTDCAAVNASCEVEGGNATCRTNAGGDGDSCATAMLVTNGTVVEGASIVQDFNSDHSFTDPSCEQPYLPDQPDAVFVVELKAGERLMVSEESDSADTVLGILKTCADTAPCVATSSIEVEKASYVATTDETVYVFMKHSRLGNPITEQYRITFGISTCGDGVVEGPETCDDGNAEDGDGCGASCAIEWAWGCDEATAPSQCYLRFPELGTYAAGAEIADTIEVVSPGVPDYYVVTFTEDVLLSGTLTGGPPSDVDFYVLGMTGNVLTSSFQNGDETFDIALLAGTYVLGVLDYDGTQTTVSYTLALATSALSVPSLGSFGAGETIPPASGGAITAPDYVHYTIEFTEDLQLTGTLTHTPQAAAVLIYDTNQDLVQGYPWGFMDAFQDRPVPPGRYIVQLRTFTPETISDGGDLSSYQLTMTSSAP